MTMGIMAAVIATTAITLADIRDLVWNPPEDGALTLNVATEHADEIRMVQEAATVWNYTLGYTVFEIGKQVTIPPKLRCVPFKNTVIFMSPKRLNVYCGNMFAIADANAASMTIRQTRQGTRDFMVMVLIHELGHLLGLEHSDDPEDIMYGSADSAREQRINETTLKQISKLNLWRFDENE